MLRLSNKVAIVTGGARGLGKAFCVGMADEGAKIIVADILAEEAQRTAEEITSRGGEATAVVCDITSEKNTQHMATEAIRAFGRIDILVNNAGALYGLTRKPFMEIPVEEWDRVMTVNIKGAFLCCRAVFPQMKKQGKGKIINISSNSAFGGPPNSAHYVASKSGVVGLTRCIAADVAKYGLCVNSVAPGVTETEATRDMRELKEINTAQTPLGRIANPEDIVGAVIFFASDESNYVTAQTLIVDGGRRTH